MSASAAALETVQRAGGPELAARLRRLDAPPLPAPAAPLGFGPGRGAAVDYDVLLLGGGLSLLYAPLLAEAGLRVGVIEQHRPGQVQREWNASWDELQALVDCGLLSAPQLDALVLRRYREGICRWHGGGTQRVRGVLDCAVDAGRLLDLALARCVRAGVHLEAGQQCCGLQFGAGGVAVQRRDVHGQLSTRSARVVLEGRGAQSPYAGGDLICPTVGGVFEGLQFDPSVGEILVTTQHAADGRQLIWEAFPGRDGQLTVYLFYYAARGSLAPQALQRLYETFFALLPAYKAGRPHLVRPTFGLIPGWSRLVPAPRAPHPRMVLLGDAAARQSPLTFCGFGATLRSLAPVRRGLLAYFAADPHNLGRGPGAHLVDDRPVHTATGALARIMAQPPPADPAALNGLLHAAFAALEEMGQTRFAALLQDRLEVREFVRFLWRTQRHCGNVPLWRMVWQALGPTGMARWGAGVAAGLWRAA